VLPPDPDGLTKNSTVKSSGPEVLFDVVRGQVYIVSCDNCRNEFPLKYNEARFLGYIYLGGDNKGLDLLVSVPEELLNTWVQYSLVRPADAGGPLGPEGNDTLLL
jgi:hypothetical protein